MTNKEIVKLLKEIAAVYTVLGESRFRIIAYEKAAESIEGMTQEVFDLWKEGRLNSIPGIGTTLASHLDELFRKGAVPHFNQVKESVPQGMFALLELSGFGPKRAHQLAKHFDLIDQKTAVDELLKAAEKGKIAQIPGFGEKREQEILESIAKLKKGVPRESRISLFFADQIANRIIQFLQKQFPTATIDVLGSMRRRVATIGDIDIAVATLEPEAVIDHFLTFSEIDTLIEKGPTGASITLASGMHVDLRVQNPAGYGAMLQYFTGSKQHNIALREYSLSKGFSLSEYGIKTGKGGKWGNAALFATEEAFYKALGFVWIPPEIRENKGEIQKAQHHDLPHLVQLFDIKGDLHIHSNYDFPSSHDTGAHSVEELLGKAAELGYEYIGISDHNPKISGISEKDIIAVMKKRKEHFEKIKYSSKKNRVHFFIMMEVDILTDGKLALPDSAFEYIDAAIVSIHSVFDQSKEEMTRRILRGLSHPKAKIFGHPTTRLLGKREGIQASWNEIFDFCKQHNKALEINASPRRLDLPDQLVFEAIAKGVKFVIDTDSHDKDNMTVMNYGVDVGRRGWAEKKDILNTLGYNEFKDWLIK